MDWEEVQQVAFGSSSRVLFQPCAVNGLTRAVRTESRELVERCLELFVRLEFLNMQALYRVSDVRSGQDFHAQKELNLWKMTISAKLKHLSSGCDSRLSSQGAVCPHLLALLGAARLKVTLEEQRRRAGRPKVDAAPVANQLKNFRAAIVKTREYREAVALFVDACGDADTLAYCLQTPEFG